MGQRSCHLRSSELTRIDQVTDCLLTFSSNLGRLLYRFRDTARCWLKIANFSQPNSVPGPEFRNGAWDKKIWNDGATMPIKMSYDIFSRIETVGPVFCTSTSKKLLQILVESRARLPETITSVNSNRLLVTAGKPRYGPIFNDRQSCRMAYRKRLRDEQRNETTSYTNELHNALMQKTDRFSGNAGDRNLPLVVVVLKSMAALTLWLLLTNLATIFRRYVMT